jgi:hypothetical protein
MSKLSIFQFILIFITITGISASDPPVFKYIGNNDIPAVAEFIRNNNINGIYSEDSTTLLIYSVQRGSNRVVEFLLLKGADPNMYVDGKSPLMYAILKGSKSKINTLLNYNANINDRDIEGNHSLIYAAIHGDPSIVKILLKHGAYLNLQNKIYLDAYDFAVKSNNSEVAKYLKFRYEKNLPELTDGPYISWDNNNRIKAYYFHHDSVQNISKKITRSFKTNSDTFLMKGFFRDTNNYLLMKNTYQQSSEFKNVERILVIGDIHGGYDSLVKLLINNRVIDLRLNWNWGNGHLVFLGDIFDRGDKVTETLWLIYKLDHQSMSQGGAVHLLFGNHEILVLLKNQNYINDKYYYLCKKLKLTYGYLFNKNTILGKWLRSNNTAIKIDDKLFVHAGISPEIIHLGVSLEKTNEMVRFYLNHPERNRKYGASAKELIMGDNGPFWYRGYLENNYKYKQVTNNDLEKIFNYYDVSKILTGHTNVQKITSYFDNKVFLLDVPFYSSANSINVLLFENDNLFLLNSSGKKTKF